MKGTTTSLGLSGQISSDFRNFKKSVAAYVMAKSYKHWPGVIELLEATKEK